MDADDPRTPLLGRQHTPNGTGFPCQPASVYQGHVQRSRVRRVAAKLCSVQSWRRRMPITIWLPKYSFEFMLRDAIAGITVGLTSIPQGIAYAMVAGLPPQVGLYSSIFPGLVYAVFGSCKDVTVGPTAILSALLIKYVAISADFAYLASFLSGCFIMLLGVLQLGFLLDFISKPVISGFTTAAALQISASQLKSLFRITGGVGGTFIVSLINFFKNIKTVQLWDTVLGITSIISLLLLKRAVIPVTDTDTSVRIGVSRAWQYVIRARNALVVFVGALLAYCLYLQGLVPFALTGKIEGGLPHFGPPPFTTMVGNKTLAFDDMMAVFGAEGLVLPLVTILESIAIAKAFAGSTPVDGTQEMIAIGAVNMISSFCQSMPATGSFTRTALNHASGVVTPAGSIFKASLVLLAVTFLSEAFFFIPRSTLAGIIMVAMASIIEVSIIPTLWRHTKMELLVYTVTVLTGACAGLEYGILCGACLDAVRILARAAKPQMYTHLFKVGNQDCVSVTFLGTLSYAAASRIHSCLHTDARIIIIDGRYIKHIDLGVAENMISVIQDLEQKNHRCLFWNFKDKHRKLVVDISPEMEKKFVTGVSVDQHILGLELTQY